MRPLANTDLNTSFSPACASETRTRNRTSPLTFQGLSQSSRRIQCQQCERWFMRPSDKARHKCSAERMKPVQDQRSSSQCARCKCWFLSRGGMAVHTDAKSTAPQMIHIRRTKQCTIYSYWLPLAGSHD